MSSLNQGQPKIEWALEYAKMGWHVFPCHSIREGKCSCEKDDKRCDKPGKHPQYDFRLIQNGLLDATADSLKIKEWWTKWPDANIGGVTGAVSGVVAFDLDTKGGRSVAELMGALVKMGHNILPTVSSNTGQYGENRGTHFYYNHPGVHVKTVSAIAGLGKDYDMKGDGGYVILPPSNHFSGINYEWSIEPEGVGRIENLEIMPEWLLKMVGEEAKEKKWLLGKYGVPDGMRNVTAGSMAGKILHNTDPLLWESLGWAQLKVWNQNNKPPMSEKDLRSNWDGIREKYFGDKNTEAKAEKNNQADKLVELIKSNPSISLFHSDTDEPFIQFSVGNHKEYWLCKSKQTKRWLAREYWNLYKKTPNSDAISNAMTIIEALACFDGPKYKLENRVAARDNNIWYDLADDNWGAIKISNEGWETIANPPVLFRRYSHQQAQVIPLTGGDIWNIFKYINLKNEDQKLLFLVWIVSCFIPEFPHPIIYLYGPQGSAKSTTSKLLRKIIDPSVIEVSELHKDTKELMQKLYHHWFLMFDNVSHLSSELSDLLCRAVSGSGFSKRELHSDDSDIIYIIKRCLGLNGINLLSLKPDLLERSILLELERIPKDRRRQEQELLIEFNNELPQLLGTIFTIVSRALVIRPTIRVKELPRMADFALWGCAIAEAMGLTGQQFMDGYLRNIRLQTDEVINDNVVASFIDELMNEQPEWIGSSTELLKKMEDKHGQDKHVQLPKAPNALSRKINELKTNLEEIGVIIEVIKGPPRKISIRKVCNDIALIVSESPVIDQYEENVISAPMDEKPPVETQDNIFEAGQLNL